MPDTNSYADKLDLTFPMRERAIRTAISILDPPPGSRGLDAGCGPGSITRLLAEAVGPKGHVTGLDSEPEFLRLAQAATTAAAASTATTAAAAAATAALAGRLSFREGDVRRLPFDDDAFDWTWSVDCVGYAPMEPLPIITEMIRVVKPGGKVALMAWSAQQLLPGYPQLEARLNATAAGMAPFAQGRDPSAHFFRALGWFQRAGLQECMAHAISVGLHAPLSPALRLGLISLIEMRWPGVESELSTDDWALLQRLVRPESPDFVLDLPDYYGFFTYTLFEGKVPRTGA